MSATTTDSTFRARRDADNLAREISNALSLAGDLIHMMTPLYRDGEITRQEVRAVEKARKALYRAWEEISK